MTRCSIHSPQASRRSLSRAFTAEGKLLVLLALSVGACGESDVGDPAGQDLTDRDPMGGGNSASGGGSELNLDGDTDGNDETCDGLDNNANGTIDEDCACTDAATQACYPSSIVPEGCHMGVQTCEGAAWSASACVGATQPPEGETACCTALGAVPKHAIYEAFLKTYPAALMPKTLDGLSLFTPTVDGYDLQSGSQADISGEFVDEDGAGVVEASIKAGQDAARELAKTKSLADGWKVLDDKAGDINIEIVGGPGPCNGVGWAWGSLLLETPELAVREVVYLYVGYCAYKADGQSFFYSQGGVEVCQPPVAAK